MPASRPRRVLVSLFATSALIAAAIAIPIPASAATVSMVIDGVTYVADDANPTAGATATAYTPGPTAVVIPATVTIGATSYVVTAIGPAAFMSKPITSVVIPDTVLSIGNQAFRGASALTTVDLGDGVQTIGEYAFTNDNRVTAIVIPDSVTSIGQWAFDSMDLRTLTIGSGLTAIGVQVFSNNNRLESVVIPPGIVSIDFAAFAADDLRTLVIGSGVTTIGNFAFAYNNRLTSVVIPASVTSMGNSVFQNNSSGISLTAVFEGATPAVFGTSVFAVSNPVVVYRWRFGDPQTAGGYTSPTWRTYPSHAMATLTFDTAGHGLSPADQDVQVGTAAAAPTAPAAVGLTFDGWAVLPGGAAFDFATLVPGDLDLEARWSTAPAGGGSGAGLPPTGRDSTWALAAALLLLGAGIAMVLLTRRRFARLPRRMVSFRLRRCIQARQTRSQERVFQATAR